MTTDQDRTAALLLALCRATLDDADAERVRALSSAGVDWQRLADLAQLHGVVGLVWRNLAALDIRAKVAPADDGWQQACQTMQRAAAQIAFDGMLQLHRLGQVVQALRSAGIEPIVLKGPVLADLVYGDPLLRPSTDLDLLVRDSEVTAACAALEALGARLPSKSQVDFQLANSYDLGVVLPPLAGKPGLVELHWDVAPRGLITVDLDMWRRRAQPCVVEGEAYRRLSPEDTLLHLALHMRKHRYVGLRWLCDIAELVRRFGPAASAPAGRPLQWDYVVASARLAGMAVLLYVSLSLAGQLLAAPVADEVLRALKPSALRRRLVASALSLEVLVSPVEKDEIGWTQRAPLEVWLLDRPAAMVRELRYRLLPPAAGPAGEAAAAMSARQRLTFNVQRLADRGTKLLRR